MTATSAAPPEAVWALLADVTTWPSWSSFDEATLEDPGPDVPGGVGAVRRFRRGRWLTRERVVAYEPNERLAYELLSGIPIRDYRADVTLRPSGGGTEITWESRFRGRFPIPGRLVRPGLQRFIEQTAAGLAESAGRRRSP